jgi:peroxiredoxin Q/BCP
MIELPKATKGRRMSKKTRKKSPKAPASKAVRAPSKTSAKMPAAKARKAVAKKSGKSTTPPRKTSEKTSEKASKKTSAKAPVKTAVAESHKAESKPPKPEAVPQSGLTEGGKAPAFRLPRDGGDTVSLADFAGRKLVLFFYPRADTPGCTKEAIDFTRLKDAFAESQTAVLGVSADPPRAQEAFRDKHELSVPLVSDEKHEMLEAYGAWGEKSMYGKTFMGIPRTTVLIGSNGRILRIWRHVRVDGHADEVLAAVRSL